MENTFNDFSSPDFKNINYDLITYLFDSLKYNFPSNCEFVKLHDTNENDDIWEFVYTPSQRGMYNKCDVPKILLLGGIHGDSRLSPMCLLFLTLLLLDTNNFKNFQNTNIMALRNFEFHIIPCLNTYGYMNNSKYNENGVDIDFNGYNWDNSTSLYKGDSKFSEKQSQILNQWIDDNKDNTICFIDVRDYEEPDSNIFSKIYYNNYYNATQYTSYIHQAMSSHMRNMEDYVSILIDDYNDSMCCGVHEYCNMSVKPSSTYYFRLPIIASILSANNSFIDTNTSMKIMITQLCDLILTSIKCYYS